MKESSLKSITHFLKSVGKSVTGVNVSWSSETVYSIVYSFVKEQMCPLLFIAGNNRSSYNMVTVVTLLALRVPFTHSSQLQPFLQ